jgi:hypothetical protein
VPYEAIAALHLARGAGEGEQDQRIFQALGLVHGHHLDQLGLAFQAHDLLFGGVGLAGGGVGDLLGEVADQRVLAVERGGGLLQQFGQVQQIGQRALAAVAREQARRQVEGMQQVVQHGQHAVALPGAVELAEALAAGFPPALVRVEAIEFRVAAIQAGGSQRGAHGAIGAGLGAGFQPQQQIRSFRRAEHRIAVGEIDAAQAGLPQRGAHDRGLAAAAHQDRHVARRQRHQHAAGGGEAAALLPRRLQQSGQPRGGLLGHALAIGGAAHALAFVQHGQLQGGQGRAVEHQFGFAAARADGMERQAALARAERERAGRVPVAEREHAVDRAHQRRGGAVVGVQRPHRRRGGRAGLQVGVDVGAAEGVDGLLRIADQQQPVLRAGGVDAVEDAPL